MFGKKKDRGESRTYVATGSYVIGDDGRLLPEGYDEVVAIVRETMADALRAMAEQLDLEVTERRRHARNLLGADILDVMVSGS